MTWWAWTVLWLVLVIGAAGYLFLLGRSLWRTAAALLRELGAAAELAAGMSKQAEALRTAMTASAPEPPAVFADPQALRRARDREIRRRVRRGRASARRGEPARRQRDTG